MLSEKKLNEHGDHSMAIVTKGPNKRSTTQAGRATILRSRATSLLKLGLLNHFTNLRQPFTLSERESAETAVNLKI
jgi:hypothetical protein